MECFDFMSETYPCSYLDNIDSKFHYYCIKDCTPYFYNGLLERGYRRFGEFYFVPRCATCTKCITVRQLVDEFYPSKNMKAVLKKNTDTLFVIRRPLINDARICLYVKYHKKMTAKKGWVENSLDMKRYRETFVDGGNEFGYEMCFYRDDRLIGVSYFDIVEDSMSAVYFFYDHDYEKLSLGVLNILMLLGLAQKLKLKYFYPGYWIKDHHSMGYKYRYRPFESLMSEGRLFEQTKWKRFD